MEILGNNQHSQTALHCSKHRIWQIDAGLAPLDDVKADGDPIVV